MLGSFHVRGGPEPRLVIGCLRVMHNAPDYLAVAISHIVVILVPMVRVAAFASGYQDKVLVIH